MNMTATKTSDAELLARIEADTDEPTGPAIGGDTLRALAAAGRARANAEETITDAVAQARSEGLSWAVIGAVLGVSRQGALKRYGQ